MLTLPRRPSITVKEYLAIVRGMKDHMNEEHYRELVGQAIRIFGELITELRRIVDETVPR